MVLSWSIFFALAPTGFDSSRQAIWTYQAVSIAITPLTTIGFFIDLFLPALSSTLYFAYGICLSASLALLLLYKELSGVNTKSKIWYFVNKKTILFPIFLAFLYFAWFKFDEAQQLDINNWKSYSSPALGISFKYPKKWKEPQTTPTYSGLTLGQLGDGIELSLSMHKVISDEGCTRNSYFQYYPELKAEDLKINDKRFTRFYYGDRPGNQDTRYYCSPDLKLAIEVMKEFYGDEEPESDQFKDAEVEKIISSIKKT